MLDAWKDFYEAVAGAASALAGLVFVAMSINLTKLLEVPGLHSRAAQAIVVLASTLFIALVTLMPHESPMSLGLSLLAVSLFAWTTPATLQIMSAASRQGEPKGKHVRRVLLYQVATLPLVGASVALLDGAPHAAWWLALGVLLSLILGLISAWILLVEILR